MRRLVILMVLVFGVLALLWVVGVRPSFLEDRPKSHGIPNGRDQSTPISELRSDWTFLDYPQGAVEGEGLLYFSTRSDYLAYLATITRDGFPPLGQIDELLVLRLDEATLMRYRQISARGHLGYNFRVTQPAPPAEVNPAALADLKAYGAMAREIVGELEGDGSGVMVGVLDSGIFPNALFDEDYIVHIDLVGGGVDGSGAEHGTAVASIISGRGGVAPNAELFVVRVLDDTGTGHSFHAAEGIVQAVDQGARVINMSLGVYEDTILLRNAVRYAHQRGVLLVAAAGNDGYAELPYPAAYPEVLAVTAIDESGQQAGFSNQSSLIDFAAPGVGVLVAKDKTGASLFTGTSAAAPFVSGTLAAMLSANVQRSSLDQLQLLRRHLNDAGPLGTDALYGDGVIDWDRIRERNLSGRADMALADIYVPRDAKPGTTVPVQIVVQNRGTKWLSNSVLKIVVGDAEPVEFSIESLASGQSTKRTVYTMLPIEGSGDSLKVAAEVSLSAEETDVRSENNFKGIQFRLAD